MYGAIVELEMENIGVFWAIFVFFLLIINYLNSATVSDTAVNV